MSNLIRRTHTPFSLAENFQNMIDRFFGESSFPVLADVDVLMPATDIEETEDAYRVSTELPGVKKGDVHVSVLDGVVTIEASSMTDIEEKTRHLLRKERRQGKLLRRFTLGENADESRVDAHFEDGLLEITIHKVTPSAPARSRAIPVQ